MPDDSRIYQYTGRGREAESPEQIPSPGWKDILWRSWREISENNIFLAAGGVSYAVVLALFPAMAALVAIYGLVMDPSGIQSQVDALSEVLPNETRELLRQQLQRLISGTHGALGFAAVAGLLFALWSASRGMIGMISALNIAYQEKERRGFVRLNAMALILTIGLIVGGIVAMALVAVLPSIAQWFDGATKWLLMLVQWPVLMVLVMVGLGILYRYGPSRESPRWRWVSPGAFVATAVWLAASICFSVYVANFASYNKTYGAMGGAIVLLTWLYISAFAVLFGGVVNAQSELQTRNDTTTGAPTKMGERGAHAADRVGQST